MTKDERFLIELYRQAQKTGDFQQSIAPEKIAKYLGFKEKLTHNILRGLLQANLVTRDSSGEVKITKRGLQVAQELLT